jgi:hypothetical protein
VAALTPLSVDGMIVAASTTLLAESRGGEPGWLPALDTPDGGERREPGRDVAVAEPAATGRVIAAWPSFELIASYELLMRQARRAAETATSRTWMGRRPTGRRKLRWPQQLGRSVQIGPGHIVGGRPGRMCGWRRSGGLRATEMGTGRFLRGGRSGPGSGVMSGGAVGQAVRPRRRPGPVRPFHPAVAEMGSVLGLHQQSLAR